MNLIQDQLAFLVHGNFIARLAINSHLAFLAVERITHVIPDNLLLMSLTVLQRVWVVV